MNEISRIHLARVSYEIDVTAKKELEKYLVAVKRSLGDETDAMEDIEIRMTEILAERGVVKDSVVTEVDVKAIIDQLGQPKDFASNASPKDDETTTPPKTTKRYFRDSENAVFGGVIAGLAAYTGWDVTLLRVLAVILTIVPSWGTLIIVYIIVWICAPEAKSVSEKMEMRGEPVNLGSLKDSAKDFEKKAEAAGREMSEKASEIGKKIEVEAPRIGNTIGRVILMIIGITGVVICATILCGLVISGIWAIPILAGVSIESAALLFVTVGLAFGCAFMIVIAGIILSSMLIDGRPKKHSTGLLVTVLISMALLISASVTGVAWVSAVGQKGIDHLTNLVNSTVRVDVDSDDENVKVEIKPFKIKVETN